MVNFTVEWQNNITMKHLNQNNMKTAVEWLEAYLKKFNHIQESLSLRKAFEQAKEMEKEQHQETWFESTKQFDNAAEMTYRKEFEQYYKETFNN